MARQEGLYGGRLTIGTDIDPDAVWDGLRCYEYDIDGDAPQEPAGAFEDGKYPTRLSTSNNIRGRIRIYRDDDETGTHIGTVKLGSQHYLTLQDQDADSAVTIFAGPVKIARLSQRYAYQRAVALEAVWEADGAPDITL